MRIRRAIVDAVAAEFPRPLQFGPQAMTQNTAVVVQVEEAGGAVGFGYAPTFGFGTGALRALVAEDLAPRLAGIDVDVIGGLLIMADAASIAGRPAGLARQAAAMLEMALWDLESQLAGVPLCTYWGQSSEPVRSYASGGWRYLPIDELATRTRSWAASGFEAVKVQVGLSPVEDATRVRSVRDSVGPEVAIMLDANNRIPVSAAADWVRALVPYSPEWLEEPFPAEDHAALGDLRTGTSIPIAAGESETEPAGLEDLLDRSAVDVIQPDAFRVGLAAARAVRDRANRNAISVAPHMAHEISAHLLAGVANHGWLEYFDWFEDWWVGPIHPVGGRITPSTVPGHGLRLRPGWLESHRI